jgi:REP element-mobilizing transposase RayT
MILGYHVIFGAYGFWLPNDPRGSWSEFVASWELAQFGRATKVSTTRSLASAPHDLESRQKAKSALKYPPVHLSPQQILAVATGFERARTESTYVIYACSILPEHVHMVIGRHDRPIRRIVGHFKTRARQQTSKQGLWPSKDRPVWGEHSWAVYLDRPERVRRAIRYVQGNPEKEGSPRQCWAFVTPYEA